MKLFNGKELVKFDDNEYKQRAKNMSPDALWLRQCLKHRTKISSGFGVGTAALLVVPTLGASTVGLWISGRTLDIARRKECIIDEEVKRRNLQAYQKRKRDYMIPIGLSLAVITTVGVVDLVCLAGTTTSVLSSLTASQPAHGLAAMLAHPGHSLTTVWHGFTFENQQFFHISTSGSHLMGVTLNECHTAVVNGCHQIATSAPLTLPPGFETPDQIFHQILANLGSSHAAAVEAADQAVTQAALHGANPVELASTYWGMKIAEELQTQVARDLVGNTGLLGVKAHVNVSDSDMETSDGVELTGLVPPDEVAQRLYLKALTGEAQIKFIFLSQELQPISQSIFTPAPESGQCCHFHKEAELICRFCEERIVPAYQAYYHCCNCSSKKEYLLNGQSSYDICEVCVAGRGCGCPERWNSTEEHVLARKGLLGAVVDRGRMVEVQARKTGEAKKPKTKKQTKKQKVDDEPEDLIIDSTSSTAGSRPTPQHRRSSARARRSAWLLDELSLEEGESVELVEEHPGLKENVIRLLEQAHEGNEIGDDDDDNSDAQSAVLVEEDEEDEKWFDCVG